MVSLLRDASRWWKGNTQKRLPSKLWLLASRLASQGVWQGMFSVMYCCTGIYRNARSIYGHIDFLGKGATSLLEDVSKGEFLRSAPLTATLFSPNLKYEYGKNCPNYNFSSFPMFGWIIRKRCREFRKHLIIASKTILYPKSSLCAETLPVDL